MKLFSIFLMLILSLGSSGQDNITSNQIDSILKSHKNFKSVRHLVEDSVYFYNYDYKTGEFFRVQLLNRYSRRKDLPIVYNFFFDNNQLVKIEIVTTPIRRSRKNASYYFDQNGLVFHKIEDPNFPPQDLNILLIKAKSFLEKSSEMFLKL